MLSIFCLSLFTFVSVSGEIISELWRTIKNNVTKARFPSLSSQLTFFRLQTFQQTFSLILKSVTRFVNNDTAGTEKSLTPWQVWLAIASRKRKSRNKNFL
jgi:hypothetical protein